MGEPKLLDEQEYLVFERGQDDKHELIDGVVYAMAGASLNHLDLSQKLGELLGPQIRPQGCRPLPSDTRVRISGRNYLYPDLTIVCGEPEMVDDDNLVNPLIVFEVLSPSTWRRDRGIKLLRYLQIPSLQGIVFIEQDAASVELAFRLPDGSWDWQEWHGLDAAMELDAPKARVPLAQLYEGVQLA